MLPGDPGWTKDLPLDLFIESFSDAARTVQIRGFSDEGPINGSHSTNADRSLAGSAIPITEFPRLLTIRTLETSVKRGACYVKVSVRAEGVVIALLCAGYVTDAESIAWPQGTIESSISNTGLIRSITGTNPAAGVEISETVPTGARWLLYGFRATFVTDATATTRTINLIIDDGTTTLIRLLANGTQTASITRTYNAIGGITAPAASGTDGFIPLPYPYPLSAGFRIATITALIQAGDNWGAPQLLVEEWITP